MSLKRFFFRFYEERKTKANKRGKLDEHNADPNPFDLYHWMCKISMEKGDIFTWAFTLFQSNCMSRSINIEELTSSQLSLGKDSLIVKYCNTKMGQAGEKLVLKIAAITLLTLLLVFITALGCFIALNEET